MRSTSLLSILPLLHFVLAAPNVPPGADAPLGEGAGTLLEKESRSASFNSFKEEADAEARAEWEKVYEEGYKKMDKELEQKKQAKEEKEEEKRERARREEYARREEAFKEGEHDRLRKEFLEDKNKNAELSPEELENIFKQDVNKVGVYRGFRTVPRPHDSFLEPLYHDDGFQNGGVEERKVKTDNNLAERIAEDITGF